MCLYPKLIKNRKYIPNKKNGGVIPAVLDKRVLMVPVGCGKCMECKKQKGRNWQVRLSEEIKENKNGKFVTLTFSNESYKELSNEIKNISGYDKDNEIATLATRRFLERWRKKYKRSVKHWLVSELGSNGTENIHLHGIIWTDEVEEIKKIWKYGHVFIGEYVNESTINYIVKYINKIDKKHREYNSKILTSAGIGKKYTESKNSELNKYKEIGTKETYTTKTGRKINLPIYYRNKIYTDEEKEKLWIEKLDKKERWVNGIKIDISKSEEIYNKILKQEQIRNKQLGYGDSSKNWELKRYENEKRNLKQLERISSATGRQKSNIFESKKQVLAIENIKNEKNEIPLGKIEDVF